MTQFQKAVLAVVRIIPLGKVMSYGQIAAYIGTPRAARQVGWAMRSLEGVPDFPWWRVLNNSGHITIKGNHFNTAQLQKDLLQSEGVTVSNAMQLVMAKYRFRLGKKQLQKLKLGSGYIEVILAKYNVE